MRQHASKIVAVEHLTLDGVYQAPARPDEDMRDGFAHGGWGQAGSSPRVQELIGRQMAGGWSLLVGRTTYEDLHEGWPVRQPAHPMTRALTGVQKFVVSRDRHYQPAWENSTVLAGDGADAVARLKRGHDKTLVVFGSGVLLRSLLQRQLVDALVLMIHPLVLGQGRRLFEGAAPAHFSLKTAEATDAGVWVAEYAKASA